MTAKSNINFPLKLNKEPFSEEQLLLTDGAMAENNVKDLIGGCSLKFSTKSSISDAF